MKFLCLLPLLTTAAAAQSDPAATPPAGAAESLPASYKFVVNHVEAGEPQIIRIFNLDGGPRTIVLPPASLPSSDPDSSRVQVASGKTAGDSTQAEPIRVFNLSGEGTREILQSSPR